MAVAASRMQLKVPTRLTSITLRNAARSCADSGVPSRPTVRLAQPMPAAHTIVRSGPCSSAAATAAATCSASVTSART